MHQVDAKPVDNIMLIKNVIKRELAIYYFIRIHEGGHFDCSNIVMGRGGGGGLDEEDMKLKQTNQQTKIPSVHVCTWMWRLQLSD